MIRGHRWTVVIAVALVLIAAVFFALFYLGDVETPAVSLPTDIPLDSGALAEENRQQLEGVEITPDNVQAVIAALSRVESHYREITLNTYWDDEAGSGTRTAEVWTGPRGVRVSYSDGENWIVTESSYYFWYGEDGVRRGSISDLTGGGEERYRFLDEVQGIPSYETVLDLDPSDILDAGYAPYPLGGGETYCIYLSCSTDAFGQTDRYYIDLSTGLLIAFQSRDGDSLTYAMETETISVAEPPEDTFLLPDGTDTLTDH